MKRIRLLGFFLVLLLLLGEAAARLLFPALPPRPEAPWSQQHPYIRSDWIPGTRMARNVEGIGGQEGVFELKINEFGFRSQSMKTAQKPPGTLRLFFLGGSTTENLLLPEEKTFSYLVERKLAEALPHLRFESVNAGISGYMASDVLALFLFKVTHYEPDLVTVMSAVNDLRYGTVPTYDPVRNPDLERKKYRPDHEPGAGVLLKKILRKSRLFRLVESRMWGNLREALKLKYAGAGKELEKAVAERMRAPVTEVPPSKALGPFIKSLREIIFIARGHGIRLLLMTEPSLYQENPPEEIQRRLWMGLVRPEVNLSHAFMLREMERFNAAVRRLSQEEGVELIDLEKEIPKDLDHFYDDVHLTVRGSERAASVIASYLLTSEKGSLVE